MAESQSKTVPCPTCGRPVEWTDKSPWRPFCSERCKLIDLGAWASEQRSIAGDTAESEEKPKESDESDDVMK
jgi:endogenous inhibitor of DNA gyrase (YacG/DUF329 family)